MIKAVSLFSGAGIGTTMINDLGIELVVANEIIKKRADFHKYMYPNVPVIVGDITKIENKLEIEKYINKDVKILIATPPCQGVSSLGINKKNEQFVKDERNFLIYDIFYFIDKYNFDFILIENVSKFLKMNFPTSKGLVNIKDIIREKYSKKYNIEFLDINSKNYGIPQSRPRCFIKIYNKQKKWSNPQKTKEISLKESIGHLPSIESGEDSGIKNHKAKKHNKREIECMKYTASGQSAMKNEKYYPKKANGEKVIGFHNTYKRLDWNQPCHARTTNSGNIGSHNNVHPGRKKEDGTYSDARVLTLRELFIVSTINPDLDIPERFSEAFIRRVIGESVPPLFLKNVLEGIF